MISGTITDASGRTLTGQTPEAFWYSVAHARPISVGLNCALGATDLVPHIRSLSEAADVPVSVHPNAGLPDEEGLYNDSPAHMARVLGEMADRGMLNIAGGCCGTRSDHIRAIRERLKTVVPRRVRSATGISATDIPAAVPRRPTLRHLTPPSRTVPRRNQAQRS